MATNIEDLTIGQLKQALSTAQAAGVCSETASTPQISTSIIVLDRGFVYVGTPVFSEDKQFLTLYNARNIRIWGTTKGLGELANNGPTTKTQLDQVGEVLIPVRALMHILSCKSNW